MGTTIQDVIDELKQKKKNTTYDRLVTLMMQASCCVRPTRSEGGCKIWHPSVSGYAVIVPKPHGRSGGKHVKGPYVTKCIRLLEQVLENGG